jgi:hypothetical protein
MSTQVGIASGTGSSQPFNLIFVTAFLQPRLKLTRYLREEALASGIEIIDTSVAAFIYCVA